MKLMIEVPRERVAKRLDLEYLRTRYVLALDFARPLEDNLDQNASLGLTWICLAKYYLVSANEEIEGFELDFGS